MGTLVDMCMNGAVKRTQSLIMCVITITSLYIGKQEQNTGTQGDLMSSANEAQTYTAATIYLKACT